MWSDTNPTGITTTAFVPDLDSSPRWSPMSGSSHGWDRATMKFRDRTVLLLHARWHWITLATLVMSFCVVKLVYRTVEY